MDFYDQRRGRPTLIRNLLDRLPDTRVGPPALDMKPLEEKPAKEKFGVIEPVKPFPGG